jgi:uncharacterized ion transporter superfamily protein YfcC
VSSLLLRCAYVYIYEQKTKTNKKRKMKEAEKKTPREQLATTSKEEACVCERKKEQEGRKE